MPILQTDLIRLAIAGIDTEIAALQAQRAQLVAMGSAPPKVKADKPKKKPMSPTARAAISRAMKARWVESKKSAAKKATKKA